MTINSELDLLERISRQQQELVEILNSTSQCVSKCDCSDTIDTIRTYVIQMQEELAQNRALTKELVATLEEDTALLSPESEQFEYWNK